MYASQQLSLTSACVRRLVPALIYAGCLHHDAFFFFFDKGICQNIVHEPCDGQGRTLPQQSLRVLLRALEGI